MFNKIIKFMRLGGQTIAERPLTRDDILYYEEELQGFVDRLWEEAAEIEDALATINIFNENEPTAEILDGCIDVMFVAATMALRVAGETATQQAWEAITKANLFKVDGSLGPVLKSLNGKILKPKGFKHPDIGSIIEGVRGVSSD